MSAQRTRRVRKQIRQALSGDSHDANSTTVSSRAGRSRVENIPTRTLDECTDMKVENIVENICPTVSDELIAGQRACSAGCLWFVGR